MLAITIGFASSSPTAEPVVLYAGRDAGAADALSLTPPAGIVRTQLLKNPISLRTRHYPENIAPPLVLDGSPTAAAPKEKQKRPAADA